MHSTGVILHGKNKALGNLWIVYDGPMRLIALLWDGHARRYAPDFKTTKHDVIKPGSILVEATIGEIHAVTGGHLGLMPQWAKDLSNQLVHNKPISGVMLAPNIMQKINKALGLPDDLTSESEQGTVKTSDATCASPKSDTGRHKYVAYTGLSESFEFCEWCDKKREKSES